MPKNVDDKKTLKVSGVSQLLRDQITKEFQRKGNSTGFKDDVNRLQVCPNGKDYVLVEFGRNIPEDTSEIGDTLKIDGTELKVQQWNSQTASADNFESESVSKFWQTDEVQITPPNNDQNHHQSFSNNVNAPPNTADERENRRGKNARKAFGKEARKNEFDQRRPGLNSDHETTPGKLFNKTKVTLNDDLAKKIEKEAGLKNILKEKNVELHKGKLTGAWNDIFTIGRKLLSYFYDSDQGENKNDRSQPALPAAVDHSQPTPPAAVDQPPQSEQPDEKLRVNSLFLRYIMAYHYKVFQKLENESKEISFEMISKSDKDLKIIARDGVDKTAFSQTVDEFIAFYQAMHEKVHQEIIPVSPQIEESVISDVSLKFSVVIDSTTESDKITIYGEKDKVKDALDLLKSKIGGSHTGGGRPSKAKETTGERVHVEKNSCILFRNVKLSVYQGDITKETSDVIVNPANEDLKHCAGAAAAIVKAGGKSIEDESNKIMKKRWYRRLNPGEVVATAAGNLPCNLIVHVVGPRWSNYSYHQKDTAKKVLLNAVLNSLTIASQNGATSISIPAISSGIFGVPVEICAEVLFNAVTDFSKTVPKSNSLKDIRFVNIDKPTSQVFAKEMGRRFGVSIQTQNVEVSHSNNVRGNERSKPNGQTPPSAWKQNPIAATGAADPKTKVDYKGSQDPRTAGDKSNLNPSAKAFSASKKPSSSKPPSYSNAVKAKATKEKDKNPAKSDPKSSSDEKCSICWEDFADKKTLDKCGHSFCSSCIDEAFKHQKKCPLCSQVYGPLIGNQPDGGKMIISHRSTPLPGYGWCGTIVITYTFASGVQGSNHPNPGQPYQGIRRAAYLPDTVQGQKVSRLLQKAFDQKLTFTIGRSSSTGANNVITWNDIHHKTNIEGGSTGYGYPDKNYLKRVEEELAAKGITE